VVSKVVPERGLPKIKKSGILFRSSVSIKEFIRELPPVKSIQEHQ
jgi:hypothetical protein